MAPGCVTDMSFEFEMPMKVDGMTKGKIEELNRSAW